MSQAPVTPLRKSVPCPQCGAKSDRVAYPFCSKRCADLDLGNWLNGRYAIASDEEPSSSPE
ncbi:MAG: DNA gyrase inhibitor YacG [Pseudomonadota bacterium]